MRHSAIFAWSFLSFIWRPNTALFYCIFCTADFKSQSSFGIILNVWFQTIKTISCLTKDPNFHQEILLSQQESKRAFAMVFTRVFQNQNQANGAMVILGSKILWYSVGGHYHKSLSLIHGESVFSSIRKGRKNIYNSWNLNALDWIGSETDMFEPTFTKKNLNTIQSAFISSYLQTIK